MTFVLAITLQYYDTLNRQAEFLKGVHVGVSIMLGNSISDS